MSTDIVRVEWSAVTDDGFAFAEIPVTPFERVDIHEINTSFYYTGDGPGLIRLYRRLNGESGPGTWILYTDMTGELSYEDDAKWVLRRIRRPPQAEPPPGSEG